jgi:hypothetical protein
VLYTERVNEIGRPGQERAVLNKGLDKVSCELLKEVRE